MFLALDDFQKARVHIAPHVHRTPVFRSRTLSGVTGCEIFLKAQLLQKAGSYKVRGPLNVLANMATEDKARGVICSSAGNHAQGWRVPPGFMGYRRLWSCRARQNRPKLPQLEAMGPK